MLWRDREESTNVEDRRGMSAGGKIGIGGGIGGIIIAILYMIMGGGDIGNVMDSVQNANQTPATGQYKSSAEEEDLAKFTKVALKDIETVWSRLFREQGKTYEYPKLVLFKQAVSSACGRAGSSTGPFYCPADSKVYIDLSFFQELKEKFNAPGDFAIAYVIAHEVGHHVQNLLGISEKVQRLRTQLDEKEYNQYLIRLELQADYFAGVWAHYAEQMNILEAGDIEEAMNAASAVGDDRIQKKFQGYVVPDSFTHGTAEQRSRWFMKGYKTGDMNGGDTFNASVL